MATASETEWQTAAKNLLKGELARRGISYRDLAERLGKIGIRESERNLANKISRGGFTVAFLLQVMKAIEVREIRLD